MSSPSRSEGHADHATKTAHEGHAHDDHAHAFDPEPAREIAADEPRTPGWLPLLGISLFVIGGTYFLATGSSDAAQTTTASASASVAAAPVAPPPPPRPTPSVAASGRTLTIPNNIDRDRIRQALEAAKQGAPSGAPIAAPPPGPSARPNAPPAPPPPRPQPLPGGAQ